MSPEQSDIEPKAGEASPAPAPKQRPSFGGITRQLTESEMQQTGVHKLLASELDRLDGEVADSKEYRSKFFESEKRVCILEEKRKKSTSFEIMSMAMLAVGSAITGHGLGLLRSAADKDATHLAIGVIIFGVILTASGIAAKVIRW